VLGLQNLLGIDYIGLVVCYKGLRFC
jgi:hypothetical protein